jgi:hypothetical protein
VNNQLRWIRVCQPWSSQYRCTNQAREHISNDRSLQETRCRHCQSSCLIHKFETDVSALKGPTEAQTSHYRDVILNNPLIPVRPDFANRSAYYLQRNYLKFTVVPLHPFVTSYEEKATYIWSALISDLGGQSGL